VKKNEHFMSRILIVMFLAKYEMQLNGSARRNFAGEVKLLGVTLCC
jgi:hypothetical protein